MIPFIPLQVGTLGTGGMSPPYPAPSGFQWTFVKNADGQIVTSGASRIVALQKVSNG